MQETPFFFAGENYNLFGVLHQPTDKHCLGAFVFCHPCAEEKLWTHRVFVSFARELAQLGYAVLRFDYMGHGDSDGDFKDSTLETRLSDIDKAVVELKSRIPGLNQVGLLGMRFGALLAALVANRRKDINKLVLWEPITDGSNYMMEMLRTNLTTQLAIYGKVTQKRTDLVEQLKSGQTVNIDGYELSNKFFEQCSRVNLLSGAPEFEGETLVVQIGKEGQPIKEDLRALSTTYKHSDLQFAIEEPFWREIKRYYGRADSLFDITLGWFRAKL